MIPACWASNFGCNKTYHYPTICITTFLDNTSMLLIMMCSYVLIVIIFRMSVPELLKINPRLMTHYNPNRLSRLVMKPLHTVSLVVINYLSILRFVRLSVYAVLDVNSERSNIRMSYWLPPNHIMFLTKSQLL